MGFWKSLFGGKPADPEAQREEDEARRFDVLKYDGVRALKAGRAAYAAECFRHALGIADDPEVRDYLSQALTATGELPAAYEQLQRLAEVQPDNQQIFIRMAHVAYMMEDYGAMGNACEKAMLIDQQNPEIYYMYARGCMGQDDTTNAVAMLTRAIGLNADFADAYLLRAAAYVRQGDTDAADEDAAWLMERAPQHEDVLLLKARIEAAKGNWAEAIGWYDKVSEANPFSTDALRERAEARRQSGDEQGAQADLQALAELLEQNALPGQEEGIEQKVKQAYRNNDPLGIGS